MVESKQRQQHEKQYNVAQKGDTSDNNQPSKDPHHQRSGNLPTTKLLGKHQHNNNSNQNNKNEIYCNNDYDNNKTVISTVITTSNFEIIRGGIKIE